MFACMSLYLDQRGRIAMARVYFIAFSLSVIVGSFVQVDGSWKPLGWLNVTMFGSLGVMYAILGFTEAGMGALERK